MKVQKNASALLVSLILISSILAILFLTKEKWISQQNITQFYSEKYLADKYHFLALYKEDKNKLCQKLKKDMIIQSDFSPQKLNFLQYQFECQFNSLFRDKKPTKEKYIPFVQSSDYLDLANVPSQEIYTIRTLSELPPSSEDNPKIVIAQNEINENLPQDFYGIVITDYLFDITGKKMYGALYSSFDNAREERNLTFKKEVISQLEAKYSYWQYLPHSENTIGAIDE
ncbi:DUF2572 domain-containing protein [Mannheimia sp. HC-2023]|uniref:DUF2572 domain-containing protein n=1 Tax=Mannheimia indoligenes TaxID=3103145 RepID=UPI002FE50A40